MRWYWSIGLKYQDPASSPANALVPATPIAATKLIMRARFIGFVSVVAKTQQWQIYP
jgi:hypothetical protein